jgi:folate-binding protein YgfZ
MDRLAMREFHEGLGARFTTVNVAEVAANYGEPLAEHAALRQSVGVLDLSFRGRICLTGADRVRFLHGQVTNDVNRLGAGEGCYAALTTAKGRLESDLNIYRLEEELLMDFEPGLTPAITQRLEKYIVADDVQVVDVASQYGLLSAQGPKAQAVVDALGLANELPVKPFGVLKIEDPAAGEIYLINQPRLGTSGFDLFVPNEALDAMAGRLVAAAKGAGGCACGWEALEVARIEAGVPRFGQDMDETNIPIECGIQARAISFTKGCYVGQEVINRIHTLGHVNKELRGLRLSDELKPLPAKGDKLFHDGKEVGYVTSSAVSPLLKANIALGYVRREVNQVGTELILRAGEEESRVRIVPLPFVRE